jgi:hypothetical protein
VPRFVLTVHDRISGLRLIAMESLHTLSVHGHIDVLYCAIVTKNLSKMVFIDIFRELFYNNLSDISL